MFEYDPYSEQAIADPHPLYARLRDEAPEEQETLVELARQYRGIDAQGRIDDPALRDRITRAEMDFYCNKLTLARSREATEAGSGATVIAGVSIRFTPPASAMLHSPVRND